VFRHDGTPTQFVRDAAAHHIGRASITMHHINLVGWLRHGAQPGQQLVGVGMGRRRDKLHHFGVDIHIAPMDAQRLGAAGQRGSARAGGLVTGQDDHVAVVAGIVRQVV